MANDNGGQQQDQGVSPESARTFLSDYGHAPDGLKTMPDPDVLKLHGTVSAAQKKALDAAVASAVTSTGEKWRENYVSRLKANAERAGDKTFDSDKMLARLQRYASADAAFDALVGLQNKVSSGEFKAATPFPANGSDEQKGAWRREHGLPEKPDAYELKLPPGKVLGEEDQPVLETFRPIAHSLNYTPEQLSGAVNWYLDFAERQAASRHEEDVRARDELEDALRAEWGGDYRKNKAMIEAFWDLGGAEVKEVMLTARAGDGTPLASHPAVLRYFADRSREVIDGLTLVPGDAAAMGKSVEDELRQLKEWMGAPRGSVEYKRYWDNPKAQERYQQLLRSQDKLAQRAKAA